MESRGKKKDVGLDEIWGTYQSIKYILFILHRGYPEALLETKIFRCKYISKKYFH